MLIYDVINNVVSVNQYFASTFSMQIFKSQRRSCNLSLLLSLCRQKAPERLLVGLLPGNERRRASTKEESESLQGNSKSDNAQSNESSNPENEWQTVDAKKRKKKNKTRRKKINEAQSNAHDDTENSTPANESTTLLIGDSMIKNIQGTRLGKAVGHRVVVKSFSGATTKAMKDYL